MRRVVFGGANSLDNFFAREDGSMDWLLWSEEAMGLMKEHWKRFDTMIMGRKTYDVAMASQPPASGADDAADPYGGIRTYVFSRTLAPGRSSGGAQIIADDPGDFVRDLKQQDGKDICVMGGGDLAHTLFEAGVIDEIGFNIHPVLLGSGIPLFHKMTHQIDLDLIDCRRLKNGCVYVLYNVRN